MNRKNLLSSGLLIGSVAAVLAAAPAFAEDATTTTTKPAATSTNASTNLGVSAVDAGKLIGEDVIDANGKTVGEIESVIVNTEGKVTSVVLDVSGWLESEKRISVPWKDLKADADGKIHSSLTKDTAKAAADFAYKDQASRGKVLNESGQVYAANDAAEPSTNTVTATNTDANTTVASPAQNADGSLNASKVVGVSVVNNNNDSVGKIGEVLLNQSGEIAGVVVDVGGFLGIGTHPVKLTWKEIKLVNNDGSLQAVVNMDKAALKAMPEYKATNG